MAKPESAKKNERTINLLETKKIPAAEGIVINQFNQVLLIYRRDMWDLPKGHVEKNEAPENCALREVSEETGLKNLQSLRFVGMTEHVYYDKNKEEVAKQTYWYEIKANKNQELLPLYAESIERAIRASKEEARKYLNHSFDNLKEIFEKWVTLVK